MLKLIVEDSDYSKATVVESIEEKSKSKQLMLRGIFAKAEQINKNNRKYHFDGLKKEFDRFVEEDVNTNRAFGNFEHPTDSKIDREKAAVRITKIECDPERKIWLGEAVVMQADQSRNIPGTVPGNLLATYIGYGSPCGFSTRGCGEINKVTQYVEPYTLLTVDCTMNPSCNEFCNGILESKGFMIDVHGQIVECALNDFERMMNSSARTYDLEKKREIYKAALDTLLKQVC